MPAIRKPTEREKQKFLEYVEKKRLEGRQNKSSSGALNPKQPSSNLFIILIDDFFEKIDALEQFKAYDQQKKDNFKGNIVNEILDSVINGLTEDAKEVDKVSGGELNFASLYTQNENYDELFFKIDSLVSTVPAIADRFLTHLIMKYISLCKEFYILPTEAIIPFVKDIDKNYN